MTEHKLNQFLRQHGMRVTDVLLMSGQSPQTIRNWYGNGVMNDKSLLILCLIAAYKWRKHTLDQRLICGCFEGGKTLKQYLKPLKIEVDEVVLVSGQSPQTLRNWLNAHNKYLLIDIMVDAVLWRRYAKQRQLLDLNSTYREISQALQLPITINHDKTKFTLEKFIKTSSRAGLPTWNQAIVERREKKSEKNNG